MKKILIFLSICLFFSVEVVIAQNKTQMFCKIIITPAKNGENITIDYGKRSTYSFINDTTILAKMEKINGFNNDMDALNYMTSLGWELIKAFPLVRTYSTEKYIYLFKKEFKHD